MDLDDLKQRIALRARELGFQQMGVADLDLSQAEQRLHEWLAAGRHGGMDWMAAHGNKRSRPAELEPDTVRVLSLRMDYLPPDTQPVKVLRQKDKAYVSRYALGRDYHKVIRKRLARLADWIRQEVTDSRLARAFVDSAPVMEKPLAEKAGLGWQGKHTLLLNRDAGSWFFLGELYTDLPLPVDRPGEDHCGKCSACMTVCPTDAIVAPYQLDARRCISYLTIEHDGPIPEDLRPGIGNRVFGCDDCQLMCPWNRFASHSGETDFRPRHGLEDRELVDLFQWDEATFLARTAGSPIRRAGFQRWRRNLAVALGNGPASPAALAALEAARHDPSELVREHVVWALRRLRNRTGM
ncbi:MAG: tRNA epoxyqueuosine(34) reductase QueG [Alcanivorax sp.]|nr:tRNA epoxyqueuosine(34) reductase QueG [Alcanivorax sp.]MAY11238.1 tRNA epoxyqueuosine(34) reductase QueG [Alcanivorax sp.]HCE38736.1 tRNA epoxyqueuosine(34) reductase QueG [Alcanivorax sp.]|tara:strand:+ start:63941 stop:64999 length:1059 start_codon:yes stop_codon:yes gene_type:complete